MELTNSRFLTIQALLIFLWLDLMLRVKGFQRAYDAVVRPDAPRDGETGKEEVQEVIDRTLSAIRSARKFYWRVRRDCLPKSLTLYLLLRSQGVPAQVCIGVRKYPFFGSHAWVEVGGRPLDENPDRINELALLSRS